MLFCCFLNLSICALSVALSQPGDKRIQKLGICRNGPVGLHQVGKAGAGLLIVGGHPGNFDGVANIALHTAPLAAHLLAHVRVEVFGEKLLVVPLVLVVKEGGPGRAPGGHQPAAQPHRCV